MIEFGGHGTRAARIASKIIESYLHVRADHPRSTRTADAHASSHDWPLVLVALLLSVYGVAMVYSAGQTDVPTVGDARVDGADPLGDPRRSGSRTP